MPLQSVNGADLYYEEYGSGPDVVVSAQNRITNGPESYLEMLAAAGMHVFSIQLRGFGRSSPAVVGDEPAGGWYPLWAEDVVQLARARGVDRFIYTGVSHGAGVGWNVALLHPEALRAFVAVVGGPHDRSKPRVRGMGMASVPPYVVPTEDPVRLRRRTAWLHASEDGGGVATAVPINPGKVLPELETNQAVAERLSHIHVPTLLLNGAQDDLIPAEMALIVGKAVPHSKLVIYQDHSHTLAREAPERLVNEVVLFLKEIGSPLAKGQLP
jgi:pimeloyl-ACP methyl ester carboxylesterase